MRKFIPFTFAACLAMALVGRTVTGVRSVRAADEGAAAGEIQFEDNFETLDASWGEAKGYGVQDGKFFIALEPNTWQTVLNQSNVFTEVDATIQLAITKLDNPDNGAAGLAFWAADYSNYYALLIDTGGRFSVGRYAGGKRWMSAVPWKAHDAIKKGEGETNELRVVTKDHNATLFINGVEVGTFKGQHPEGGQTVGMVAESWSKEPTRYEFAHLKVM